MTIATESQFALLSSAEVCTLLRISRTTLWRIVRSGELRKVKVRGGIRFRRRDVERYVEMAARRG